MPRAIYSTEQVLPDGRCAIARRWSPELLAGVVRQAVSLPQGRTLGAASMRDVSSIGEVHDSLQGRGEALSQEQAGAMHTSLRVRDAQP